jgi:hypothetical protein
LPAPGIITKIEVDPTDANRVYLTQFIYRQATGLNAAGGFWYSTDGGINWTKTFNGLATGFGSTSDISRHALSGDAGG